MSKQFGSYENLTKRSTAAIPDTQTFAEESTDWSMVSRPTHLGGLGFGLKWDMGWMHDTLKYMSHDPVHRRFHHNTITFRMLYAFHENFVLPLSHDEVVHGKGSLLSNMPGDLWQKFANLRLLFGYMFGQPGKKLLFMGGEFGQWNEWYHEVSLDWHLLDYPGHAGVKRWLTDLNRVYREQTALHEVDFDWTGFDWIDCNDVDASVLTFLRRGSRARGYGSGGLQFYPGAPGTVSRGSAPGGVLAGIAQQQCPGIRRQRPGQWWRSQRRVLAPPRPAVFPQPDLAAPVRGVFQTCRLAATK